MEDTQGNGSSMASVSYNTPKALSEECHFMAEALSVECRLPYYSPSASLLKKSWIPSRSWPQNRLLCMFSSTRRTRRGGSSCCATLAPLVAVH